MAKRFNFVLDSAAQDDLREICRLLEQPNQSAVVRKALADLRSYLTRKQLSEIKTVCITQDGGV